MNDQKRDVSIQVNRIGTQDFVRNYWVATVEPHITREDLMLPEFWANVAVKFKQFDRIEVRWDDGKFFAEYLILNCDRISAHLKELTWVFLSNAATPKNLLYDYKWGGPHGKHGIIRTSDSKMMVNKLETKEEALRWLTQYLEKIQ